jgi:anti-sigma B factor antagonist
MAKIRVSGDVQIVELSGDITVGYTGIARPLGLQGEPLEEIGETLDRLLSAASPNIVVDLRRVRFIDSAGIGDLVRRKQRAVQQGGDIRLVLAGGPVEKVLKMMRLDLVFQIFKDDAQAVDSFGAGPTD